MKKLNEICFIVQARVNSERVPKKMIRNFAGTTLVDIMLGKLVESKLIPNEQIYFSVYDKELIDIGNKYNINIFNRSYKSANIDGGMDVMFEWYNKLPYKYVILVHSCQPLIKIDTIEKFLQKYMSISEDGLLGVIEKKNYFWNKNGNMLNKWPEGEDLINTKAVEVTYEAAHCLYGAKMSSIGEGVFAGSYRKVNDPVLFPVSEFESFDIDYDWQFKLAESI